MAGDAQAFVPGVILVGMKPGYSIRSSGRTTKPLEIQLPRGVDAGLARLKAQKVAHAFGNAQSNDARIKSSAKADFSRSLSDPVAGQLGRDASSPKSARGSRRGIC